MIEATVFKKITNFINCPDCGSELSIDESMRGTDHRETLYCNKCGTGIILEMNKNGRAFISIQEEKLLPCFVLLKSQINGKRFYFVLKRSAAEDVISETADIIYDDEIDLLNSQKSLYNDACPASIYLRDVICILGENEFNPIDLFEYLATKKANFDESDDELDAKLRELFAEILLCDNEA